MCSNYVHFDLKRPIIGPTWNDCIFYHSNSDVQLMFHVSSFVTRSYDLNILNNKASTYTNCGFFHFWLPTYIYRITRFSKRANLLDRIIPSHAQTHTHTHTHFCCHSSTLHNSTHHLSIIRLVIDDWV